MFTPQIEANHNKDYSVVKTLGSLVLLRGIFFAFNFRLDIDSF